MDLFLDNAPIQIEKTGMEAGLSEDANDWPQQILDELYRQVPYASDYAPKVVLRSIDADRRYGLGQIELLNKMAINPRDDDTPEVLKGRQKALIPVIIQDGKLKPLDVLMYDGKVEPLTDERLKKALFRPNLFEAIRERPGDISLIEQLYPPHRQYGGARGPIMADIGAAGMGKESSVQPPLLFDAILPTLTEEQAGDAIEKLGANDPVTYAQVTKNPVVGEFLHKLGSAKLAEETGSDYLKKVAGAIKPSIIQIQKIEGGFRVKTANSEALIPDSQDIPRPAAVGALGGDMVSRVEADGTTTITTQPVVKETLLDIQIEVINSFGLYKVKTQDENRELVGWVFPKVMDFNGTLLPMALFTNGSESAMQENIAGVSLGRHTDLLDTDPEGFGSFYYATPEGAIAFIPINIHATIETPEGTGFKCDTVTGEQLIVTKLPGLKEVSMIEEGHYGIPEDCGFLSFNEVVDLASSPDEYTKVAEARALPTAVRVITDSGKNFTFQGEAIDKLAGVMESVCLSKDDAVFLGTVLGQDPVQFEKDLVGMRKQASQELWFPARQVTLFKDCFQKAKSAAADYLKSLPNLRGYLLKEAAMLEDPTAVDKILSVGFINPENVTIFASYVPEFEAVIRKLAELLVATRMGLNSVDEGALQRSMIHLDKVVAGLKTLGSLPQA